MDPVERVYEPFLKGAKPLADEKAVLAGFSGGPDSTVLLHCMVRWHREGGPSVLALHLNHAMRDGADRDEEHCREVARLWDVPFESGRVDVPALAEARSMGLEEAAREARYDFFHDRAAIAGARACAVGHILDDQAETVLLRLVRGTGLRGLRGILPRLPYRRGNRVLTVVRPLLAVPRSSIHAYVTALGLSCRRDESNEDATFTRNRLRAAVMPLLKTRFNPQVAGALSGLADMARDWQSWVETTFGSQADDFVSEQGGEVVVLTGVLDQNNPFLLHLVLNRAFELAGVEEARASAPHFRAAETLLSGGEALSHTLPGGRRMERGKEGLRIMQPLPPAPVREAWELPAAVGDVLPLPVGGVLILDGLEDVSGGPPSAPRPDREVADRKRTGERLVVRNRRPGDTFHPLGGPGHMKLKKFFNLSGLAPAERDDVPLVVTEGGEIVWVVGYRLSERFKVTGKTTRVVRMTIEY